MFLILFQNNSIFKQNIPICCEPKIDTLKNLPTVRSMVDLKISRPGLWFPTIWIYLVPFSWNSEFWKSPIFWLGLLFVTFPLNYLVYGLNDYNDRRADRLNQRKGNYLFGARATDAQLQWVPLKVLMFNLPFMVYFSWLRGGTMILLLGFMVLVNIVYNFKPFRIKERPPFEILIQSGYVATALFSVHLNQLAPLPWQTIVYLILFAFQAHIAGEIMDIEPDRLAGKKTTATWLGRRNSKLLMLLILITESYLLIHWFDERVLAGILGVFALWLVLDIWLFFKNKPYTLFQMKLFGYAINLLAVISMIWIMYSQTLLHPLP